MTAMAVALTALLSATGAGLWLTDEDTPVSWAQALVAGLLIWGLAGLVLGLCGLLAPAAFGAVALVSLTGWTRRRLSFPPLVAVCSAAVLIAPGLVDALGPIAGTDEQYLHVGLSQQLLMHEGLIGGLLHPNGSRPQTLQLVYTGLLSSGIPNSLACFHWLLALAAMTLTIQLGREHFERWTVGLVAAAMLGMSTTVQESVGQVASDIPAALAVLVSIDAAVRGSVRQGVIAAATALSIKYTAAAPLVGAIIAARLPPKRLLQATAGALLLVSPWWLRNVAEGLHPLFPFTGWPAPEMSFQIAEKWGAGRSAVDFLWLPYRAVFEANPVTHEFHGRLHPFVLLCLAPIPLAWRSKKLRPWLAAASAGCAGWALGPHWLRYLNPTLPALALVGAAAVTPLASGRIRRLALWAALLLLAPAGLQGMDRQFSRNQQILTSGDADLPDAIEFCNRHLPDDATVALLFSWNSAALHRKQILGSVEDHIPSRHFLITHKEDPVAALAARGATHALVRAVTFPRSHYTSIPADTFNEEYIQPFDTLNNSLLMKAELLFSGPMHRVYRLPTD